MIDLVLKSRKWARAVIQSFLDVIFPPLCAACKTKCKTRFFCPICWELCTLPNPAELCRHCFEEIDERGDLCKQCRLEPILPCWRATVFPKESPARLLGLEYIDAMAGFTLAQWIQLEWPIPDAIIPMPDSDSLMLGKAFAEMINRPFVKAFRSDCIYREDRLEEDAHLLIIDVDNPIGKLQIATKSLAQAFPKRIYLLTLFPYDFHIS